MARAAAVIANVPAMPASAPMSRRFGIIYTSRFVDHAAVTGINDGKDLWFRPWDCSCHGSRFALDGSVIHGPTITSLERIPVP
jgi:Rieske Fe-S protein